VAGGDKLGNMYVMRIREGEEKIGFDYLIKLICWLIFDKNNSG